MDLKLAQKINQEVKDEYNQRASDFATYRTKLWLDLYHLLDFVKGGNKILDVGCGNGRLYQLFKDKKVIYIGIDNSEKLIEIAKKEWERNKAEFLVADILNLPFENESFNIVASIAVLHHLPGHELRFKALKEISRVLKPGGILFLTIWNLWRLKSLPYVIKYDTLKIFKQSPLDWHDCWIPEKWIPQKTGASYCHAFTQHELKNLLKETDFKILEIYFAKQGRKTNWLDGKNIVVVAEK